MFERNRVDTSTRRQTNAVAAEITFTDGETLKGNFLISATRQIFDVLNGADSFLEFEPHQGCRRLIAKSMVAEIKLVNIPQQPKFPDSHSFDPFQVLGIERDTPWNEIRERYLALAKAYHSDCYAGAQLPGEVVDYIETMSRRVNSAFEALEAPRKIKRRIENKAEAIYTSQPR